MRAFVPIRSSRDIPGLRAIPAVITTTSEFAESAKSLVPCIFTSRPSTGVASSKSSAFPFVLPSSGAISTNTTSASCWLAAQWAAAAPTLPAPTIDNFLRIDCPRYSTGPATQGRHSHNRPPHLPKSGLQPAHPHASPQMPQLPRPTSLRPARAW